MSLLTVRNLQEFLKCKREKREESEGRFNENKETLVGIKQRRFNWRAATRRGDEKRGGAGSRTKGLEYGEGKKREKKVLAVIGEIWDSGGRV